MNGSKWTRCFFLKAGVTFEYDSGAQWEDEVKDKVQGDACQVHMEKAGINKIQGEVDEWQTKKQEERRVQTLELSHLH